MYSQILAICLVNFCDIDNFRSCSSTFLSVGNQSQFNQIIVQRFKIITVSSIKSGFQNCMLVCSIADMYEAYKARQSFLLSHGLRDNGP